MEELRLGQVIENLFGCAATRVDGDNCGTGPFCIYNINDPKVIRDKLEGAYAARAKKRGTG